MSDTYSEGDLIEAVNGETVIRGRVVPSFSQQLLGMSGRLVEQLEPEGFTVTVIEKAKPKVDVPTEGTWHDRLGQAWQFDASLPGEYPLIAGLDGPAARPEDNAPFTRLEPRAVTAKAVLDRVADIYAGAFDTTPEIIAKVAAEFGVIV